MRNRAFITPMIMYLIVWAGALAYTVVVSGEDFVGPLVFLAIFAVGFPFMTAAVLGGAAPFDNGSTQAPLDLPFLILSLGVISFYPIDGPTYLAELAVQYTSDSELTILLAKTAGKLAVFVVLPMILFVKLLGHPMASFGWHTPFWRMLRPRHFILFLILGGLFCAFQYFMGTDAAPIREGFYTQNQLMIGLPLIFAWLLIEVGLVEEFFFRGILQSRLALLFRNEWAALFLASLLFALAHVPGLVLRGDELGDPWHITATAILQISAISIGFGYIWMRTKNLLILMMLHAGADLLPLYADLSLAFGLG